MTQQTSYVESIAFWAQRIRGTPQVGAALGPVIVDVSDEHVRLEWVKNDLSRRPADGGWAGAALSAMAMGVAEFMPYAPGRLAGTFVVQLDIHLVSNSKDDRMVGEGRWVHRGENLLTSELRLTDGTGELVVLATATHVPLTVPWESILRRDASDGT